MQGACQGQNVDAVLCVVYIGITPVAIFLLVLNSFTIPVQLGVVMMNTAYLFGNNLIVFTNAARLKPVAFLRIEIGDKGDGGSFDVWVFLYDIVGDIQHFVCICQA